MMYLNSLKKGIGNVLPFFTLLLILAFISHTTPLRAAEVDGCSRTLSNTTSCASQTFVLYLTDKHGTSYHLSGNQTTYQWIEQADGTVRIIGTGFTHSSLSGEFLTVNLLLGSPTTIAPSGSPKSNYCGTISSTGDWKYFETVSGTVTSKLHGVFTASIRGAAFQQGTNANTNQLGYGASGWYTLTGGDGFYKTGDINAMLSTTCTQRVIECERDAQNTVGCANMPYTLWFKDKYNTAHHLAGDTSTYRWITYANGDVRFIAKGLTASGLSNDVYEVDALFSGASTSPPSGSPKSSTCFSVGSTSNWIYFQNTTGTITSSVHGSFVFSRQGPAFQQGMDANITQAGYGASGWIYVMGGDGFIASGDLNIMLSQSCVTPPPVCNGSNVINDPCVQVFAKGSTNNSATTISISTPLSEIQDILVEGIYKGGQPTSGSFTNGTNSVSWSSSNAIKLDNVNGTSDKGYYKATLPAASSVTMNVGNNTSKMHGFVAYVRIKDAFCADNYTALSDKRYYVYQSTSTTNFSLPSTVATKNLTAVLPIAEMNNDSRTATFTLTAGSKTTSVTISTYDLGQSMTVPTLTLNDVPGNVTAATLTFFSPSSNGDSYVTGNTSLNWYLTCQNETVNRISGYTYFDRDRDTIKRKEDTGIQSVTVYLYKDNNNNGILENSEANAIDSVITNAGGYYNFDVPYVCTAKYIKAVTYTSGITNPSNVIGNPGTSFAGYTMDSDNLIVELDQTIPIGSAYQVYLKTIEDGAYAIISESTDGINFYHNTNIAITSSTKNGYLVTASRNTKYIKFDKNSINTISGYNVNGSTSTNIKDYAIFGIEFCNGSNSFIVKSKFSSFPNQASFTTDNIETASFSSGGNHDSLNNFGVNGPVLINGCVFKDLNANGIKDVSEPGQGGVKVYLYNDYNLNGIVDGVEANYPIDSAVSSSQGLYEFPRLFGCMNQYISSVTYSTGITNSSALIGAPGNDAAGYTMDTDNLIVELMGTIPLGKTYEIHMSAIESGAYAIISESTDGVNFYHNTNVAITSFAKSVYEVTASRNVRYIKFDKNSINTIAGYNLFGSANTNVSDYNIHGIAYCNALQNGYVINTKLNTYPAASILTTDNVESAQFNSFGQQDPNNNFGYNAEGGIGNYCGSLKITINHTKVEGNEDLPNFPVYFDITNAALKSAVNGGSVASQNGYDVQLTNQAGMRLDIEILDYNPVTGQIKFWGGVDVLKAESNTILYLRHGNIDSSGVNPSSKKTWNTNYKAVYHFDNLSDASTNNNGLINSGGSLTGTSGIMGKSVKLNGTSQYLRAPASSSLNIGGKKLTMSAWVKIDGNPSEDAPFAVKGPSMNQEAYMFGVNSGSNPIEINSRVTTNGGHFRHDNGSLPVAEWALVHFVYDGDLSSNQKSVYVNGELSYTASATGDILQGNDDLFIGKRVYSDNRYLKGSLDELRIVCNSVSAGWAKTEYNNQKNTGSFYTVTTGTECLTPVPVTWLSFEAEPVAPTTNQLTWSTASEMNNDYFEIERKWETEAEFTTIGKVKGAGNSTAISRYSYPDYFNEPKGDVVYYRLKQVDFDGKFEYSGIRMINFNAGVSGNMINKVYPQPGNGTVAIELKATDRKVSEVLTLRIFDLSGKELTQEVTYKHDGNFIFMDVSQLPTSLYMLDLSDGKNSHVMRLLVGQGIK